MTESEKIVYISCVEEVRYSFVSHLCEALRRKGIHDVFVDCEDLLSNESQSKVERAMVSVMVLPGNHKVNLDKLAKVLECQKNKDQVVVPVLYGVIPLEIEWRRALESKGFFSSFHYSRNECTDSELVEDITRDVYEKLFYMERIGIYSKLQEIENMVWKQPFGVRCVGIWGMLGIGKTTLAKAVFDQMSSDFDAYCFIEDYDKVIHEKGLYRLLEEHFLKEKSGAGSTIAKLSLLSNKLNNTRVLVVLDDVRNPLMAEPLLGGFGWFGPKSLIIITSRDKQVFRLCRVNQIFKVQGLNEKEALQLFSLSASIKNNGEQNFHELSMKVIEYANGNPLALSIYGREFKGKNNLSEMEITFLELKGRPHFQIVDAFKSSYDSLNDRERNIFLDIACFFQGENVDYVMQLLGGCGFLPHVGIDVLVEKCLVTISENRVWMHNLIQDVGQQIINTETEQIGRRSRLWEPESIKYLLEDNEHIANVEPKTTSKHAQGSEEIEGMFLDTSNLSFDIKPVAFDNMLNLRFLKIYCSNPKIHPVINFSNGSLRYLPNELRLLHWENYPLHFLPENFDPMHLVEINMPYSQLQTLWGKPKNLKMLRTIRLCHSQKLVDVGDLSKAKDLEVIDLQGCTGLQSFPATDKLLHLRVVNLSGCSEIKEFPEVRPNIEALHLQGTGIRKLIIFKPNGGKLASLSELEGLSNALKLELLARLEKSRSSSKDLTKLICLELKDCTCLQSLSNMVNLELLKVLDLSGCSELKTIKGFPRNLKELYIAGTRVRELPQLPQSLELFNAHGCVSLKSIHLDSKKLPMHYTFSNCFALSPQVINEFLVKALANAEHIPRECQQELNKSPAFSFCAPSHANQNSTLDLQPGSSVMTRLIPSWRKTLVGFAMLVEVAFSEDYGDATGFGISCVCRWSNKEGRSHMIRRNLHCWGLGKAVQKDHMFVFFDVNMRPSTDEGNDPDIWADLVVFEFFPVDKQTKPSCTVRGCGVRVITDANCNTSIENILPVWSLDPLEVSGNEDEEALRISYDGLQEIDKALFHYIVGLFNDEDVGLVAPHIANIFDMDVSNGLKVLADRSLIRVSSNGEIVMPCLLRQMGNEILHTESKKIERFGDDSMANTMKTEKSKGKEVVCIMDAGSQSGEEVVESSEKSITGSSNPRYMLPDSSRNEEVVESSNKSITGSPNPRYMLPESSSNEEVLESSKQSITGSPNPRYMLPDSSRNEEVVESSKKSITGSPNPRYMLPDSSRKTERTINAKKVEITHSENPENPTRDMSHVPTKRLSMADTLLSFGVEKLLDLLVRDFERFKGVEEQFNKLKMDLNMLRCFLKDANAKKHTSAMVRNTVEDIKEIVYDAEDIIETFLLKEELGKTSGIKKRIRKLAWVIADRRGLALDMEALNKRIAKVIRDMQILGIQQVMVNENSTQSLIEIQREMGETFPSDKEDHLIVGLEKNIEQVVGYLVKEDRSQVVSITGRGGIGKTTLAREAFNHEMVKNHFDGVAWVCVSQQFKRKHVWQMILQQLSSKQDDQRNLNMTEAELQGKLFRLLETSNSLIVLDDMWKEEDWDRIKPAFPSKKGWKVLLTSRNENVGFHADPTCVTIKPECLIAEECWILFRRTAFYRENATNFKVDVEMEEMGKQMIKHCGGLPLAIKVLGGLLATQHTLSDWKRIFEKIKSNIVGVMSSVDHILDLSFEELPVYLKNCFLYLAHFPEDNKMDVEKLSYYWDVEGILMPRYNDGATIREVTDGYIEELVKRNMVISERDVRTSRFETCHLHDLMREVCLLKAKEENFVHIVDTRISQSSCKSRRIAIHWLDETYDLVGKMKNLKLRSLLFFRLAEDRTTWDLLFTRLRLLRVLDLVGVKFEGGKLPSSIGNLIHLRYLSLLLAEVTHLPSSMRNLRKMLYLNLSVGPGLKNMPNFLEELRELKYLYLPWGIPSKTKLKMDSLVNMEMLKNFSTEHSSVDDLQQMIRLTTLKIRLNSKGCTNETLSSSLSKLRHLENLTIFDSVWDEEGFVLNCVHLKQLKLRIYMPRLPDEQHFPSHLTTISLENCRLEEDPMPILEKLLQLKDVRLWSQSFSGKRMVCSGGGFPQLQKLELSRLEEWEEWIVEEGSMPLLHTMKIWICPKLKELPDGLRFLYSLKDLTMSEEWKERLSVGGADHDKVEHIPSVQFPVENDAQIASGLLYEERERQINHRSASQDEENEQLAEALRKSLKDKEKKFEDEQLKEARELAERLSMLASPPQCEKNYSISCRAPSNVDEQLELVLEESSNDKGKGKQFDEEQVKEDRELAERLNMQESPPRLEENNNISTRATLDEDEQRIILESLKGKGQITQSTEEVSPPRSMCGGCDSVVDHGRSVNVSGVLWHPRCFICHACDKPIAIHEVENHVSNSRGKFHKSCYKRYCYVCKEKKMEMYKYNQHPFWEERYCCAHETDGTPRCCSCERLEPTNNVMLGDGRWLCLECMESAVMDSDECLPLHFDIREYFEGLNMKIDKEFPILLVEKQALNKAEVGEKIDTQYEAVTRGICLSEEQTVISVSKLPKEVVNNRLIGMARESQRVVRKCEVTAILILYGLPRLLTGYILAHEMMHAYLRLNGHRNLNNVLEEGICQMLGHMWLEAETYATVDATAAAASSSSSRTHRAGSASKKSEWSDFEKKLGEFYKNQIETDESPVFGNGFRKVYKMMENSSIQETLKEILRRS